MTKVFGATTFCLLGYAAHTKRSLPIQPLVASADSKPLKALFSWGNGQQGQLGNGTETNIGSPMPISVLQDENIVYLSAAGDISAVVTDDGKIYTWGRTKGGSMNQEQNLQRSTTLLLPSLIDATEVQFKQVACGKNHLAAVTTNGKLVTWGNPDSGKLGHSGGLVKGTKTKGYGPRSYADYNAMDFVHGQLSNKTIKQAACGFLHSACVTEDGEVYTWGLGKNGALGHGTWDQVSEPKKIEGLKDIIKIDCGIDFTIALDKDGKLYSWGSNRYGQLGITQSNIMKHNQPSLMNLPHGVGKVVDFSCGEEHSAFLNDQGEVFTWGYGNDGQLGHKEKANLNQPKKLNFSRKISKVVCGGGHSGLISEGELFLFGRGSDGQLGRADQMESQSAYRTEPKPVQTFSKVHNSDVLDLALGSNHSLALASKRI